MSEGRGSDTRRVRWLWRAGWLTMLALIACDLALVVLLVASYPPLLRWPGAVGYVAEPLAPLIGYSMIVAIAPLVARRLPGCRDALWVGTIAGLAGGGLEIVDIASESLARLPQRVISVSTGVAMLILFLLLTLAGFISARRTLGFWPGLTAAIWCAMVAVLIAVTFGFLLMNLALPQLARTMIGDPDYLRSNWTDPAAFAIANTLDNGFTHLVEAPIIAAVLGSIGSAVGLLTRRRRARAPA